MYYEEDREPYDKDRDENKPDTGKENDSDNK